MRQAGFYLYFSKKKTDEATFFFFLFDQKNNGAPFFVHFKHRNANILILASEKIDEVTSFSSLKKDR